MIDLNLEVCSAIAVQYGLPRQYVVKEFYVFDVLGQVAALTAGSGNLVFKGGTALNKVYFGKLQRFSDDLDFDLGAATLPEVRGFCGKLAAGITGYGVTEFRRVAESIQFYCAYENPLGGRDHVRIDVAAKKILSANPLAVKPAVSSYAQRAVTGFRVYSLEDLTARKIHALRTRTEGKDVYDVFRALPLCGKMREPLRKMLESEGMKPDENEFLNETIQALKKADARKLRNLTNPFIPLSNRPRDWRELKNDLTLKLENLLSGV